MAGKVVVDSIETGAGDSASAEEVVKGCAKAWVNFNGAGTVAITKAFNVSSITDNGIGLYTANLTEALTDADAVAVINCQVVTSSWWNSGARVMSTTTVDCTTRYNNASYDMSYIHLAVFD